MIKNIGVKNYLGDMLTINLAEANPVHGLLVKKIEGLGPVKATINKTNLATSDGSKFNSSKLEERNIVIQFEFTDSTPELTDNYVETTYNIENTRQRTYRYFPAKRECTFYVKTDNRNLRCTGYVESNEPSIFEKNEGCSISIICPDPYFYSNEPGYFPHVTEFAGLDSEFEWLVDINEEPMTELTDVELGAIAGVFDKSFPYFGDQETGIHMNIHFTGTVNNDITIYKRLPTNPNIVMGMFHLEVEKFAALMGTNFLSGDVIEIDTSINPSIRLLRSGVYYNILNVVSRDSDWFKLDKGTNRFTFSASGAEEHTEFRIEDYTLYEGV